MPRFARNAALFSLSAGLLTILPGCDRGSSHSESALEGRNATVEYRKVGDVQKQRSGTLKKVTGDYVALDENGTEIWIPRDMVLEIRLDKK